MSTQTTKLEILLSTCNERIVQASEVLLPQHSRVSYVVVHQLFDYTLSSAAKRVSDDMAKRADVRVVTIESKGLSKNRNAALNNATGDLLLISDDDARYSIEGLLSLLEAFEKRPTADIITFKIATPENLAYKSYSETEFAHSRISVLRVSSLEIALRRKSIDANKLLFDEQFGLGAEYPACEEAVFLAGALRAGLSVIFNPINIVVHPVESSGRSWATDDSVRVRGALFKQLFGWFGLPLLLVFAIKQYPSYANNFSAYRFLKLSMLSFLSFQA